MNMKIKRKNFAVKVISDDLIKKQVAAEVKKSTDWILKNKPSIKFLRPATKKSSWFSKKEGEKDE